MSKSFVHSSSSSAVYLQTRIGHTIGLQALISTRSAWALGRACHKACVGWQHGARGVE